MDGKELRLVIVEDDEHDFELLSRVLKKSDVTFDKVWLQNGDELEKFLENTITSTSSSSVRNVFFLDINLPMIDGLELIKMIRSNPPTEKDYVITLTGSNHKADMEAAMKNGANLYLEKPFGKQKLLEFSNIVCSKLTSLA
jgi:CheY-like chemotaxis protein